MPGIVGTTADGALMRPCPLCSGQLYIKLLYIQSGGELRGVVTAMCADCQASATRSYAAQPPVTADIPAEEYNSILGALRRP